MHFSESWLFSLAIFFYQHLTFLKESCLLLITYLQVTCRLCWGWKHLKDYCYGSRWHFCI